MNEVHNDAGRPAAGFSANVPQAGRTIRVEPGQTMLAAALDHGIDYPHGCRRGRCGACMSRLASGSVTLLPHSRFSLSDEDKAAGLILACRAVLETDVTVMWGWGEEMTPDLPSRLEGSERHGGA